MVQIELILEDRDCKSADFWMFLTECLEFHESMIYLQNQSN